MNESILLVFPDPAALGELSGRIVAFAFLVLIIFFVIRAGKNRGKGSK